MKDQSGFSLLEILIAVSLLAFIMIGVVSTSTDTIDAKEEITFEDERRLQIQTALARMEWDVTHFYSPLFHSMKFQAEKDENGYIDETKDLNQVYAENPRFAFATKEGQPVGKIIKEGKHKIQFLTAGNKIYHEGIRQSQYGWVQYSLEEMELTEDEREQNLGRFKLMRSFFPQDPFSSEREVFTDKIPKYTVLEYIESLEFSFWDPERKKFVDSVRTINDEVNKHILRALKISFRWKGLESYQEPLLIEKVFKPIWPFFDAIAEHEALEAEKKKSNKNNTTTTSPGGIGGQ